MNFKVFSAASLIVFADAIRLQQDVFSLDEPFAAQYDLISADLAIEKEPGFSPQDINAKVSGLASESPVVEADFQRLKTELPSVLEKLEFVIPTPTLLTENGRGGVILPKTGILAAQTETTQESDCLTQLKADLASGIDQAAIYDRYKACFAELRASFPDLETVKASLGV